MTVIFVQLALLILTSWGWGFWLWKIGRLGRTDGWGRYGWFFFGLGGFMACVLFLQALVYLDLPLKFTAWAALVVAVAGAALSAWTRLRRGYAVRRDRRREAAAAGLLFAAVFGLQGTPLFLAGPANYYGSAHIDQVNYVLLSEFLVEAPFSTSVRDIGLQPWMAKAIDLKTARIGQSVADGYLAVVSLVDAKRAYGTLSVFMVGIGALGVFVLARMLSVPRTLAWLAGAWWGWLPAVTKLHLDGFFSQDCVLFIFPALAAICRVRRGRLEFVPLLLSALYLAYVLCTYTEVYVVALGLLFCLTMLGAPAAVPWWRRGAAVAGVAAVSLLLTGPFLRYFVRFIEIQYTVAATPTLLAVLTPLSGTWLGWEQVFAGYTSFAAPGMQRLAVLASIGLPFLMVCAFQRGGLARRRFLLAMMAAPVGLLAVLFSAPEFSKYPFSKLVDTFTTFWLIMAILGLLSMRGLLWRGRLSERLLTWPVAAALVLVALGGSWPQWRETWERRGNLAGVDSPAARLNYAQARRDPGAVYLVDEPNSLINAWLVYAARRSQVYVAAEQITDLPIPSTVYAFRRSPPPSAHLVTMDSRGPLLLKDRPGLPLLIVENPQGADGSAEEPAYWIGPDAILKVSDGSLSDGQTRFFTLECEALAGPANPAPERSIVLVDPDGSRQQVDFTGGTLAHFQLKVHAGENAYTLKVTRPTEQTVKLPTDPRNVMVCIRHLALSPLDAPAESHP